MPCELYAGVIVYPIGTLATIFSTKTLLAAAVCVNQKPPAPGDAVPFVTIFKTYLCSG